MFVEFSAAVHLIGIFYEAFSFSPNASACFLALSRKSAILEFLLWAAAKAAKFSGYCDIENSAGLLFIAAAYYFCSENKKKSWKNCHFSEIKVNECEKIRQTWCAADIRAGSNTENAAAAAAAAALDEYWWDVDEADEMFVARIAGRLTYGATRHGSNGVDTGGLWLDSRIPKNHKGETDELGLVFYFAEIVVN